jgi:hypothetical protein
MMPDDAPVPPTDGNGLPLHNRKPSGCGPDVCDECSYAAHNWVAWPCAGVNASVVPAVTDDEAATKVMAVIATSVGVSLPLRKSTHEIAAALVADLRCAGFLIVHHASVEAVGPTT